MKTIFNKYIIMAFAALLSLTANAAEPDWTCNASDYEYDMTVFATLSINGETVAPNDYTLAAFCGDECRGVATVANSNGTDYYYLRVRSNVKSGEIITFRAYNKTADEVIKQHWLQTTLPFTADEMTGYPSTPFLVIFQVPTYTVSVGTSPYGTIEGAGDFVESTEATLTAVPNEGYKFVCWHDGSTVNPLVIQVLGNMEVSATFAPETYTVTYMIGQEVIRIDEVEYGSVLPTEPTAPEKEGHTFAGWDEHPETMPASNLIINGSYTVNKYKLTYVIDETVISESDVEYGAALIAVEAPAKEGHTFDGWAGLPETMPAHDVMVTGSYTVNTYTLTFKIDDDVVSETTVAYGSEIVEPTAPEKEGHTFAGWDEHPETMPASNLTINGSYTLNKYKLTYIIDETVISESDVEYGTALIAVEAPAKEGHTFDGWTGLPETMPAHDVMITGSYTVNTYTLTFKIGDDVVSETTVAYGSEIVEPTVPEKEGHTFAGWDEHPETMPANNLIINGSYTVNKYKLTYMIDDTVISESDVEYGTALIAVEAPAKEGHTFDGWTGLPETMPAHDVMVTGSYTVNTYTLTFKIGDDVVSETTVAYGSEIVEPTAPEKEGHTFAGWDEHPETMPANNLIINGSYTVNKYKLTYVIDDTVISESDVEYGTALIAVEAPAKEGHTFDGWTGLPETMPAHDVMVTGSYTVNTYTLTFKIGDDVVSETTVAYGSEIVEPTAPEKEGHTFAGWDEHPETMPASNLTINGSYTINIYTVTYKIDDEIIRIDYVEFGDTLPEAPEAPEKQGYDFNGWSDIPETMPARDIIIIGKYITTTGISNTSSNSVVDVFNIQGYLVKKDVVLNRITEYLPKGIYIINRKKIIIR